MTRQVYHPYQAGLHGRCVDWWFRHTGSSTRLSLLRDALSGLVIASCALGFLALVIAGVG